MSYREEFLKSIESLTREQLVRELQGMFKCRWAEEDARNEYAKEYQHRKRLANARKPLAVQEAAKA